LGKPRTFTGTEARRLLRRARTATLATVNRDGGIPYASLVNIATDCAGLPVLLISKLAWHTQNLLADPRASIMAAEPPPEGDALTGPRVTVLGRFTQIEDPAIRRRYLARHPAANLYVDFGDFAFWRMTAETVHAVAGFGRIETLAPEELFSSGEEIAALEDSALTHMNEDHRDALRRYAGRDGDWRAGAIDCDGIDVVAEETSLRVEFPETAADAAQLRGTLAKLSR
jgi:heme iron utilization protein